MRSSISSCIAYLYLSMDMTEGKGRNLTQEVRESVKKVRHCSNPRSPNLHSQCRCLAGTDIIRANDTACYHIVSTRLSVRWKLDLWRNVASIWEWKVENGGCLSWPEDVVTSLQQYMNVVSARYCYANLDSSVYPILILAALPYAAQPWGLTCLPGPMHRDREFCLPLMLLYPPVVPKFAIV
jgi:hypothetical protein